MPVQRKLFVVAVVVVIGVAAALAFRKSPTPESETPAVATSNSAARVEPALPADKPAPVSHLTGRIDPPEQARDVRSQPSASYNDRPGFGLSTMPPAGAGYSSLPAAGGAASNSISSSASAAPGEGFSELRRHKIADGDTLSGLAVRYLGSADRYREIYELNRETLANPDLLPIGTELKIPAVGSKVSTPGSINNRPMVPVAPRASAAPATSPGAAPGG